MNQTSLTGPGASPGPVTVNQANPTRSTCSQREVIVGFHGGVVRDFVPGGHFSRIALRESRSPPRSARWADCCPYHVVSSIPGRRSWRSFRASRRLRILGRSGGAGRPKIRRTDCVHAPKCTTVRSTAPDEVRLRRCAARERYAGRSLRIFESRDRISRT